MTSKTPEMEAKFWEKVAPTGFCWEWTGALDQNGYGQFFIRRPLSPVKAHRLAYEILVGPIPEGAKGDHLCRNRSCVNPDHIDPIPNRDNVLRGFGITAMHARQTHCKNGHEFTPENTFTKDNGGRGCRECRKEINARYYAKTRRAS